MLGERDEGEEVKRVRMGGEDADKKRKGRKEMRRRRRRLEDGIYMKGRKGE